MQQISTRNFGLSALLCLAMFGAGCSFSASNEASAAHSEVVVTTTTTTSPTRTTTTETRSETSTQVGFKQEVSLSLGKKPDKFDRAPLLSTLRAKIKAGKPLVVHLMVPLCDNDHQGIVPVNASLGNGQNPRSNLYWGAGFGIKTHFKRATDWKLVQEEVPAESYLLDRAIFYKKYTNGAQVYLVTDAYDGAHMAQCLSDYMYAVAGRKAGSLLVDGQFMPVWSSADLLGFNGHNGLMDMSLEAPANVDGRHKDAVVIACASHDYFAPQLARAGGFPLLCTTNLLAPEAYVMRAVIDAWAELKTGEEIRLAAGAAYHKYQKCGLKGATRLFQTGW